MDKKYIEENEIEIKYLRNQLTPEEVEEFEVYLMENPEILERLELDILKVSHLINVDSNSSNSGIAGRLLSFFWGAPALLSCFSFLIGVALTGALFLNMSIQPGSVQIAYLAEDRSGTQAQNFGAEFQFPTSSFDKFSKDQFLLVLDSGLQSNIEYRGSVQKLDEVKGSWMKNIATFDLLQLDQFGNIVIPFFVRDYSPGIYKLDLVAARPDEESSSRKTYRFKVEVFLKK